MGLLLAVGCQHYQTRTYSISVKNDTGDFVTVALTKDGPPYSAKWASPEDIAQGHVKPRPDDELGTTGIRPGGIESVGYISGQFSPGSRAVLRVYKGGAMTVREMLAIKPGPARVDYPLQPGDNRLVVREQAGKLVLSPLPAPGGS
jgi:hypothetical protein